MGHGASDQGLFHYAIYAAHIVRLVARWGVEPETLLEGTGLDASTLEDPTARISNDAMTTIVRRALALTKEPGLGFHLGMQVKLSAHGSLGLAAMTSATLRDAVNVAERYFAIRAGHVDLVHFIEGEWAVIELVPRLPLLDLEPFIIESLFAGLAQIVQFLLGRPLQGACEVRYAEPRYFRGFAHLWPGNARFNRRANRIIFPASFLDFPLAMADDFASREAIARCEAELLALGETSSVLGNVRKQIRNRNRGFLSLTELAELRGVSTRTLKRTLAAHGTSFQVLLDELRRDRAVELLERPDGSVEKVAEALGYADTANFRRAFKRWMGVSPGTWRSGARDREAT